MHEYDIKPGVIATSTVATRANAVTVNISPAQVPVTRPIAGVLIGPESPQTYTKRPKRIRRANPKCLVWTKTRPREYCGKPSDGPHHLIGWGQRGMATRVHDIFAIPLCRQCRAELHNDPVKFKQKSVPQPIMMIRVLDRTYRLGVLA